MSGVVTRDASPLVVETYMFTVFTAHQGVSLTSSQLREVFGLTNISITDLWNNHSHNDGSDGLQVGFERDGVTVPFFTVATLMQSIPEDYAPMGKTRADVVEEIWSLANSAATNATGTKIFPIAPKIPSLTKYYDIMTYWDIRNVLGEKITNAVGSTLAIAGPKISTALTARAQYLYNFTLQNCAVGTTSGTRVDTKVQILQNLTDAPTGNTDVTGNYIQTIYNLLSDISVTNPIPYRSTSTSATNNAIDDYNIDLLLPAAPANFVGTYNAPLTALTAMAPPGVLTPALLKKLNLGASELLGSGYSLPTLQNLYGGANATEANNIDAIIVTLLDSVASPYGNMLYNSTDTPLNYDATTISAFTASSFRDVFSKVRNNYPDFTSFTKTVFWKIILPELASGGTGADEVKAARIALARSIMKLIDSAYSFTTSSSLKDRLSWFNVYGSNPAPTIAQNPWQVFTPPTPIPSQSSLAQALFMVVSSDKTDDIFSLVTALDSTVNNSWFSSNAATLSTVAGVAALTPTTFKLSLFNAAISFIGLSTITPFNDTTAIQIKKTNMLLAILASGYLDNIVNYNKAVALSASTTVTRIISLTTLATTTVNKINTKTSPATIDITVANITVTLVEYFVFLGSLFGTNLKTYQDSLLSLIADSDTSSFTNITSQISFFLDRASNTTIRESTVLMWNTKPSNTNKSYFGTNVHANLIKYALDNTLYNNDETYSVRAEMVTTIISLLSNHDDKVTFFDELITSTGISVLRNTMFDNPLLDQSLLANLINSVSIYSHVGVLMTQKGVVSPIVPAAYTKTVITGIIGTVDRWLIALASLLFPAYNTTSSAVEVTVTDPYLFSKYESVFHTANMSKFYSSLSDVTVNAILRPVASPLTNTAALPVTNSDFLRAGSWMNFFGKVNLAQSITGFDAPNEGDVYEPNFPGYPVKNIFNSSMLFKTYSFDFSNGRQTSPNAIYVQVVSGSRAVALGYEFNRINALFGNIQ